MTNDTVGIDAPNETKKKGCGFWALVIGGIVVAVIIIGSIFGPTKEEIEKIEAETAAKEENDAKVEAEMQVEKAKARREEAVKVTAGQLFQAYENNEAAAQQTYGNKLLEVSGRIDGVELDFSDTPIVQLRTSNQFMSASVYLKDAHQSAATAYSKGDNVKFLCEEVTEVMSIPQLKECVPVE